MEKTKRKKPPAKAQRSGPKLWNSLQAVSFFCVSANLKVDLTRSISKHWHGKGALEKRTEKLQAPYPSLLQRNLNVNSLRVE